MNYVGGVGRNIGGGRKREGRGGGRAFVWCECGTLAALGFFGVSSASCGSVSVMSSSGSRSGSVFLSVAVCSAASALSSFPLISP